MGTKRRQEQREAEQQSTKTTGAEQKRRQELILNRTHWCLCQLKVRLLDEMITGGGFL